MSPCGNTEFFGSVTRVYALLSASCVAARMTQPRHELFREPANMLDIWLTSHTGIYCLISQLLAVTLI